MSLPSHLSSEQAHAASMPWWRRTSSVVVLFVLFALSWIGQVVFQAAQFIDEEAEHGEKIASIWQAYKMADFWEDFLQDMFANWQSEFLQLLTFCVVGAFGYALFKRWGGSSESKDSDERIEAKLDEVLARLDDGR